MRGYRIVWYRVLKNIRADGFINDNDYSSYLILILVICLLGEILKVKMYEMQMSL